MVGEAWVTVPAELCFFQGGRAGWDGIDPGVGWIFDFPLNLAIVQVFAGKQPISKLRRCWHVMAFTREPIDSSPFWTITIRFAWPASRA